MSNKIWDDKSTDLTLNGPRLSVSSDTSANISLVAPNGQTGGGTTDQTSVTFSVTGVSTFPDGTNADGGLSYQWYEVNDGELGISTRFTGAGTSTLTISHALSPEDNGNQYYNRITFTPDNVSAGGTSGNILNNFIETTPGSLTVAPELFISAGVTTSTVTVNQQATFNCGGGINRDKVSSYDTDQENSISYQWYLDGSTISDGTVQKNTAATRITKNFGVGNHTLIIPDDAVNVTIRVVGGAGGRGANDSCASGGGGGQGRIGKFSIPDGGRTLTINVGGRGGNGSTASNAAGGSGGSSPVSRGGQGGNSGPRGSSGSGGGGAGGVFVFDSVSNSYVIAAGGGGGYRGAAGGGAGSDCPGGGGGRCLTADTLITMGDSTSSKIIQKPISEIKVGDYVLNKEMTEKNKVVFVEIAEEHVHANEELWSPSEHLQPYATEMHPIFVNDEWMAMDHEFFPWLKVKKVENPISERCGFRKLYNLWVTGDGTYIANNFGTHSALFDGGWMRQCWEQKLLTYDEVIDLTYEYAYKKHHLIHGAFLFSKILGIFNNRMLNRFGVYVLKANDSTKRKKITEFIMKLLQRRF